MIGGSPIFDDVLHTGPDLASYSDDLRPAIHACMVEGQLACQEASHLRSLLTILSDKMEAELQLFQQVVGRKRELQEELSYCSHSGMVSPGSFADLGQCSMRRTPQARQECMIEQLQPQPQRSSGMPQSPQRRIFPEAQQKAAPLASAATAQSPGTPLCAPVVPPIPMWLTRAQPPWTRLAEPPCTPVQLRAPTQTPGLDPNVTTLLIRFIPPKASQEDLLDFWPLSWGYNFLYLPYSVKQRRAVGYAFLNFVSHEAARLFHSRWEGQAVMSQGRTKKLSICPAEVQGLRANLQHLWRCGLGEVPNDKRLPALFDGNVRISFKAALQEFCP